MDFKEVEEQYKECYGKELNKNNVHCVVVTDKFLSGWGMAQGKICKRIILCNDSVERARIENNIYNSRQENGFAYVNNNIKIPHYNSNYKVVYNVAKKCPLWQ